MAYLSLYRKYRSQSFGDLMGQGHVVRTLQNSLASGKFAHAYLFTGPRGTGKTSTARLLARALNCEQGPSAEPCNQCSICLSILEGSCMDVVEMDAASEAGVENVREKIVQVADYAPTVCRYKVMIIDEVHDLSNKAFDALLKTIEEPPQHLVFILATTEYHKVPPTVRSRCQKFEFHRGSLLDLAARIDFVARSEGVEIEPAAVSAIARMADGGFRDALTLLEQAMMTSDEKITLNQIYDQLGLLQDETVDTLLAAMKEGDLPKLIITLNEIGRLGRDPRSVVESMLHRLSDLTRAAFGIDVSVDGTTNAALHELAARLGQQSMLDMRSELNQAHLTIRDISLPRLWLEGELVRISNLLNAPKVQIKPAAAQSAPSQPAATQERTQPHAPVVDRAAVAAVPPPPPTPSQKEATVPEPEMSGDAELDKARTAWHNAVQTLAGVSKILQSKLLDTKVASLSNGRAIIQFSRQIDCDWLTSGPKAAEKKRSVLEAFQKAYGSDIEIDYIVHKGRAKAVEPEAVELPAEGERLHQLAKEIFPSN